MKSVTVISIVLVGLFLSSSHSFAVGKYAFQSSFENLNVEYVSRLDQKNTDILSELPSDKQTSCIQRYKDILEDGIIDIRIALGYIDWTSSGGGPTASMDLGAFAALKTQLLSPCRGNARICGFQQDPRDQYHFTRSVMIHGQKYLASIEMNFSSAAVFLSDNLGKYREEQKQRTQFMENYFSQALQKADAVFYFGHSRNGGGPDFSPPVFKEGTSKVNYDGYYEIKQPGLKKLMASLSNESKTSILGLMSCSSRDHFLRKVRSIAPDMGVITSMDVLNLDYVYTATVGGVDAILRGQCQRSFYESLRMTEKNKQYITMDGMFKD